MAEFDVHPVTGARGETAHPFEEPIPTLENGDRLTRCEFEHRYAARPDIKKAESIEGIVYMPSPVRLAGHAVPHSMIQEGCCSCMPRTRRGSAWPTTPPFVSTSTTSPSPTCCYGSRTKQVDSPG